MLRRLRGPEAARLIDPTTGEILEIELFAAVLGASNYTYAEATRTQQVPDWIASHTRAFAFFGGVTAAVVCDQLKSGVIVPCRYEPGLQRTYEIMWQPRLCCGDGGTAWKAFLLVTLTAHK